MRICGNYLRDTPAPMLTHSPTLYMISVAAFLTTGITPTQPAPESVSLQTHPLTHHTPCTCQAQDFLSVPSLDICLLWTPPRCPVCRSPLPPHSAANTHSPHTTPTCGQNTINPEQTREKARFSGGLGGEDLPSGEVGGLAPRRLLSPSRGSSSPLFLMLGLPLSRLLGQPHRGSRAMFSESFVSTSSERQR